MNDITALALLVSKAKASVFTMKYISQFEASDIDSDDVDLRFEVDGVETGTNVSIVDECGQAAQMITALVEALEKREELRASANRVVNQQDIELQELRQRNAELIEALEKAQQKVDVYDMVREDYGLCEKGVGLADFVDWQAKRIAELESRNVTVKLPKRSVGEVMHMSGFDRQYAEGWCSGNDNAINEMKLAGIQVIEGEA